MKTKSPLISVIMLNYNGLKYIKRTIPQILKLDYPNYEFIIVDNGSADGSIEFIKEMQIKSEKVKIRLIENGENLGYSKGKNIGVKHAKGEYVLLLDNDVLIKNIKTLEELIKCYASYKKIAFLYVPLFDLKKNKSTLYGVFYSIYGTLENKPLVSKASLSIPTKPYFIGSPTGADIFFKKSNWKKIGEFDDSQPFNIDDVDIGARSWILGYENYSLRNSYFYHLGIDYDDNKKYVFRTKYYFSGNLRAILKNYNTCSLIKILPLFILYHLCKSIFYSIKRKDPRIFFAFFSSVTLFLKNLQDTLKQRKIIQSKRVIKEDIFLRIKPPKFG